MTSASVVVDVTITTTSHLIAAKMFRALTALRIDLAAASDALGVQVQTMTSPRWSSTLLMDPPAPPLPSSPLTSPPAPTTVFAPPPPQPANGALDAARAPPPTSPPALPLAGGSDSLEPNDSSAGGSAVIIIIVALACALLVGGLFARRKWLREHLTASGESVDVTSVQVDEVSSTVSDHAQGSTEMEAMGGSTPTAGASRPNEGRVEALSVRRTRALQAMTEWEWRLDGLTWVSVLGSGSFGTVYRVHYGDEILAAKKVRAPQSEHDYEARSEMEALETEFRALKKLNHPHIVKLFGVVRDETMMSLLMELADNGSLRQMLDAHPEAILGNREVQISLAFDIASGLAFCHAQTPQPLLHKDIKAANVLLFSHDAHGQPRLTAKLSDFGIAVGVSGTVTRELSARSRTPNNAAGGTLAYKAPENFRGVYTQESEVYSYAIVLSEILTGQRPWHRDANGRPYMNEHLMSLVTLSKKRPEVPKNIRLQNKVLATLMTRCWDHIRTKRPNFTSIVLELSKKMPPRPQPRVMSREEEEAQLTSEQQREASEISLVIASSSTGTDEYDIFITFRFGEAHAEALALKAGLEAFGLRVFLSNAAPGEDLQRMISDALQSCKLAVILATETYGRKTNALFCTSAEMNYIIDGGRKPYYLVRMIPFGQDWAEPSTTMAFPSSVMFKLWMPGDPMPNDMVDDIMARLASVRGS